MRPMQQAVHFRDIHFFQQNILLKKMSGQSFKMHQLQQKHSENAHHHQFRGQKGASLFQLHKKTSMFFLCAPS